MKQMGRLYFNVWMPILLSLKEEEYAYQEIIINPFIDVPRTTYIRIIDRGIIHFNSLDLGYIISRRKSVLFIEISHQTDVGIIDSSSIMEKHKKKRSIKKEKATQDDVYEDIIGFLNECTGKSYRADTKANRQLIDARLKEGYGIDDFKKVIEVKSRNWLGKDMEQYLRPATLFSNKFESYLQENIVIIKTKAQEKYDAVIEATNSGWGTHNT